MPIAWVYFYRKEKQVNTMKSMSHIKFSDKIGYSMGNVSYGIISQAIATYVVVFGTNILGIAGTLMGIAVSISVIWDALTDPVMGYISDYTISKRFGRRHQFLIAGIIGMAIFNLLLWQIQPEWKGIVKYVLLIVCLLFAKTFITIYTTPYTALGAELSNDYHERTSIQAIRTMFFLMGIMTATVASLFIFFNPTEQYPIGQNNPEAYLNLGLFTTIIGVIFAVICIVTTSKYIPRITPKVKKAKKDKGIKALFKSFFGTFKNKYFKYVAMAYLFANISSALLNTLGLHVYTYTFKLNNKETSIALGIIFLIAVISQPVWVYISGKIDKKPAVLVGIAICIVGSIMFAVLVMVNVNEGVSKSFIYIISIILGSGIGGLFSLPLSMVADTIDYQALTDGYRSEGTFYGVLTLAYKLSQSLAILLLGVLIDLSKFDPKMDVQTTSTSTVLGMSVALGCLISFVVAGICYLKYDLNKEKVDEIQAQLSKLN